MEPSSAPPAKPQDSVSSIHSSNQNSLKAQQPKQQPKDALEPNFRHDTSSVQVTETSQPIVVGWRGSVYWACFIVVWYFVLQKAIRMVVPSSEEARELLHKTVSPTIYHYSEAAFFVATMLNLVNLVFEDTPEKQQLAMLSAIIKGLSWHSDHLIVTGRAVVKLDYHGVLLMPSRYVQWSCSTPTMLFTLSRISSLAPLEVAATLVADWLMVVSGYAAAELPWILAIFPLALSFVCFAFVQQKIYRILTDAMREAGNAHSRMCLMFTLGSTFVVWNLFWIAWVVAHSGIPSIAVYGEPMTIFCNFAAKVVFSTSIMYNNFVTLAQRRRAAQLAKEHQERIQAVKELSVAVKRKDAFLEVVGHELRTPLNAILQLSSALVIGAGGPMSVQGREWLNTIKASAGHLLGVVHDILTFRATQATSVQLNQELVNVGEVVDEVLKQLLPSVGPNITLEKVVHARLPPIVADRRRLVLALSNLVANSIKFMDKAQGRVTVKAYPDRGARHVIIKVVDNGPGLTPTQLATLADISCTDLDPSTRRAGGLGLGIPITHQLMAAHGGVCRLTSPGAGQGTTALLRLPVLQAQTDSSLQYDFSTAYQALGYSLEQLLSPELAAAERRVCPAFTPHTTVYSGQLPPAQLQYVPSTTAPASVQQSNNPTPQQAAAAPMYTGGSNKPLSSLRSHGSMSSTTSSMDMSRSAIMQTYHWTPMMGGVPTSVTQAMGSVGSKAAATYPSDDEQYNMGRPSEDSLAAWEAYAEQMGYTSNSMVQGVDTLTASKPTPTAAASAKGVPGAAVALMSSLYTPAEPVQSSSSMSRLSNSRSAYKRASLAASSARDSIEECDEEGEDVDGDKHGNKRGNSVDSVPTPRMAGLNGRASDASALANDDSSTEALLNAAAAARQVVDIAAQKLSTTVQDLEAVSEAMLEADAAAERTAKQMRSMGAYQQPEQHSPPPPSDWEQYVAAGGGDLVGSRVDAPEVVADNLRLSMQYDQAMAAANAKHQPVDPQWQSWVARIPDHHRAAAEKAAKRQSS